MDPDTMTLSAAHRKYPKVAHITATYDNDGSKVNLFKPLFDSTNLPRSSSKRDGKVLWADKEKSEEKIANLEWQKKTWNDDGMSTLLAEMRISMELMNEQMGDLRATVASQNERIGVLEGTVASQNERIGVLEDENAILQGTVASQNERIAIQNERIGVLEERIGVLEDENEILKAAVGAP